MANYNSDNPRLYDRLVEELWRWAETHPQRGEVVIATMTAVDDPPRDGAKAMMLDPRDFVVEVAERTPYGKAFVEFVVRQANEYEVAPEEFIRRAIRANEAG
jgi:hypothetical protein